MGASITGVPSNTVIGADSGADLDFTDLNKEETIVPPKEEEKEVIPAKEEDKEEEQEETKEESEEKKDEDEEQEPDTVLANGHTRPSWTRIKAKYPNLFKDFPEIQESLGREKAFTEVFETVDDARQSKELAEDYSGLEEMVSRGDVEGTSEFLGTMKENSESTYKNHVYNFLPALLKSDRDSYNAITAPILDGVFKSAYQAGISSDNKNLQYAAMYLSKFIFGDMDFANGKKIIPLPRAEKTTQVKDNAEQTKIDNFWKARGEEFNADTQASASASLSNLVKAEINKIDPESELTTFESEYILDKVCQQIKDILQSDRMHMQRMRGLWNRAEKSQLSARSKTDIISAFLSRAKSEIPNAVKTMRSKMKNKRSEPSHEDIESRNRRNTVGSGGGGGGRRTAPAKVDYSKSSDRDLLDGKY